MFYAKYDERSDLDKNTIRRRFKRLVDIGWLKVVGHNARLSELARGAHWRRENHRPIGELELIEFVVAEASALAVRIYGVHPFIDGNTRATWHLRNYVLILNG